MIPRVYEAGQPFDYPTGEGLRERERPPVRFWIPLSPIIVLGRSQNPSEEVNLDAAARDGIPLYQRIGGGGAVVLTSGCLAIALRLRRQPGMAIPDYFRLGSSLVKQAVFSVTGMELEDEGLSDLAWKGRKLAGCSCYLPRDYALYLASLMVLDCRVPVERYLTHPTREPDYRNGRPHGDFMACLADFTERPVDPSDFLSACEEQAENMQEHLDWPP